MSFLRFWFHQVLHSETLPSIKHAFQLSIFRPCLCVCAPAYNASFCFLSKIHIHPSRLPFSRNLPWPHWHEVISFTHRSSWIFVRCQKLCSLICTFITPNPCNSPMKCEPMKKKQRHTINITQSHNAPDHGLNTFHGLSRLSIQPVH